mmetsp:Transcript_72795/g.204428  ORF Transcript_72795/g.204428 Transcript_72795/m.204428 type:complete len:361 (-) Transcript_72795:16-1098(-)
MRAPQHLDGEHLPVGVGARGGDEAHPGVLQALLRGHPLFGVVLQDALEEVDGIPAQLDLGLPPDRFRQDLDHDLTGVLGVVGVLAILQQVHEDAECPDIGPVVVLLADELGGEVVGRAAELGEHLSVLELARHPEVDHLHLGGDRRLGEHEVLGLDVPMDDLQSVDVLYRPEHLLPQGRSVLLAEPLELHDLREHLAALAQFHYDVEEVDVLVEVVVSDDILVLDALQKPHLSNEDGLIRPLAVVVVALYHLHGSHLGGGAAFQTSLADLAEGPAAQDGAKVVLVSDVLVVRMVALQLPRRVRRHGARNLLRGVAAHVPRPVPRCEPRCQRPHAGARILLTPCATPRGRRTQEVDEACTA